VPKRKEQEQEHEQAVEELSASEQLSNVRSALEGLRREHAGLEAEREAEEAKESRLAEEALRQGKPAASSKRVSQIRERRSELERLIQVAEHTASRLTYATDLEEVENIREQEREATQQVTALREEHAQLGAKVTAAEMNAHGVREAMRDTGGACSREHTRTWAETTSFFYGLQACARAYAPSRVARAKVPPGGEIRDLPTAPIMNASTGQGRTRLDRLGSPLIRS